jgi:alpha-galactosidase
MRGGLNDPAFPPEAFAVAERTLLESYRPAAVTLDSGGTGRSTDRDVPYVVVAAGAGTGGCFAALGWSGLWRLSVTRQDGRLRLEGEVEGLDLRLAPGERVPLPEALFGGFAGDLQDGANALRDVLRRDVAPRLAGAPVAPPVSYDHWFEFRLNVHEADLYAQLAPCAALGVEYFVVDAGWFGGSETSYRRGLGNWAHEATHRFPSGVAALGAAVRAHGMRFGLWIDPELVHPDSETGRAHPEWLLRAAGSLEGTAVLDLSRREVRAWAVETISGIVERYQAGWLRWDVNMPLASNWADNDPPGRSGWHQLQHVAGVHEILDAVLARHPDVFLEGCCGGGRRMDLGLLRRAHTFWCSDMTGPAPVVRAHQSGGNRLLPAASFNTNLLYGPAHPHEPAAFPAAAWLSHFGGPLGFSGDFRSWTAAQIAAGRTYVDAYKRWRGALAGDFYPLFPLPRSLADWDGWQFHNPQTGEGLLVAFRGDSPLAAQPLAARHLPPGTAPDPLLPTGAPPLDAARDAHPLAGLAAGAGAAWSYRLAPDGERDG